MHPKGLLEAQSFNAPQQWSVNRLEPCRASGRMSRCHFDDTEMPAPLAVANTSGVDVLSRMQSTLSQSEISGNPHIPHVTRGHSVRYQDQRLSEGLSGELSSQLRRRGMGLFMLRSPDIRCAHTADKAGELHSSCDSCACFSSLAQNINLPQREHSSDPLCSSNSRAKSDPPTWHGCLCHTNTRFWGGPQGSL